ncbi:aspartyl-phosphate phosphatase Spo0E family protein [Peribacillus deserti]|uniref:Spo0E family sporulation regulatory protein-aspartic acid phosphatase n=1 Tax=Peribacillus deserti TaxID=673318 RepID=A0A2N5M7U5_9BACI|nr:aspartyl-phosphate phosphatase Spo0E family protein [Peribacillus deserti]PLT30448.1 Spo0E family sporulation regulatory protein-aspartic acid phosphatase [Peribacillus deserti]
MNELLERIVEMQQEMISIAAATGLNSQETLTFSQKLDILIIEYQRKMVDNKIII